MIKFDGTEFYVLFCNNEKYIRFRDFLSIIGPEEFSNWDLKKLENEIGSKLDNNDKKTNIIKRKEHRIFINLSGLMEMLRRYKSRTMCTKTKSIQKFLKLDVVILSNINNVIVTM
jgi:hypothetical protein